MSEEGSDYQQMESLQRRGERLSGKASNNGSPQSLKDVSHVRTKSDITPSGSKAGRSFTLSRSKSIASARDRWKLSASYGLLPFLSGGRERDEKEEREGGEDAGSEGEGGLRALYAALLRQYDGVKEEWRTASRQAEEARGREAEWQEQAARYKAGLEEVSGERNKYKGQCTQAIRQWDQALRERSTLQEQLAKAEKQKEELLKEVDQAMNIRIKASKDIKRLTEERNSALHEYSVMMGERGGVIREVERLQEELAASRREGTDCQLLQREIAAALADRDSAIKEVHELRRKLGMAETGDAEFQSIGEASEEVVRLRAKVELLDGKLKDSSLEADVAKGRRDWAFAERDKIMLENESVQSLVGRVRQERDQALAQLAEGLLEGRPMKGSEDGEAGEVLEPAEKDCLVKQGEVQLAVEEGRSHGILLGEGVYVRALRPGGLAARSGRLAVGDRLLAVNGTEVARGLGEARRLLAGDRSLCLRTESLAVRAAGRMVERSVSHICHTPDRRPGPAREVGDSASKPPGTSRLWASSERVYNISNNTVSKEPKKAWSAFTETVKEKFVKGTRRQSAEPGEGEGDYLSYRVGEARVSIEPAGKRRSYSGAHQDAIKDINHLLKNHHIDRRVSDAESLENLDNKIQEMRQTFSSTQSVRGPGNLHRVANPQDVVQSHYQQVQSMIQGTAALRPGPKEDYFLASSASETSLNDSLKSGALEEHEVLDQSSCSTVGGPETQPAVTSGNPALNITSPKRSSPFPAVASSLPHLAHRQLGNHPAPGDIRQVHIEKTTEQLGINIREVAGEQGGVFLSSVAPHSLAARVGLHVGDQILEVCGINLRTARFPQAQAVLQMASRSIDIKVQYQPARLLQPSPAPASPLMANLYSGVRDYDDKTLQSGSSTLKSALRLDLLPSAHSTLLSHLDFADGQYAGGPDLCPDTPQYDHEPRILNPVLKKSGELGVRLVGGNAVGIFIHSVEPESAASEVGLRCGDQILEYNGTDLSSATAEQAAYELAKPVEHVSVLVQYNPDRYRDIKDEPGDSYFIKAMFERSSPDEVAGPSALLFHKDDILQVENTMHQGVPGTWAAWLLDPAGRKCRWGIIPSKYRVEEEMQRRRGATRAKSFSDGIHELSNSTRRSFFKRKRTGGESKELAVYSDVSSLFSHTDSEKLKMKQSSSYLRVEKRNYQQKRPVLIVGPFSEAIGDKLATDYPATFGHCEPEYLNSDLATVEQGIADSVFLDFRRRGPHFECSTLRAVRELMGQGKHR
jgi:C-terminal processing protease CtpA/Prc